MARMNIDDLVKQINAATKDLSEKKIGIETYEAIVAGILNKEPNNTENYARIFLSYGRNFAEGRLTKEEYLERTAALEKVVLETNEKTIEKYS